MRLWLAVFALLLVGTAQAQSGEYTVVVGENGNALVLIGLMGESTVDIPLPEDVTYPEVFNAIYIESDEGIEVALVDGDQATIAYQTSAITSKTGSTWVLEFELAGEYLATVSLPKSAKIKATSPTAKVTETPDSKNLVFQGTKDIMIEYDFQDQPVTPTSAATPTTQPETTTTTQYSVEEYGEGSPLAPAFLVFGVLVIILAFVATHFFRSKGQSQGMKKVMRTLSGNEYKVVDTLLKNKGHMRRSQLEKTAGVSKSSLALALNNLERKNIVEVEREPNAHYVEVTKWFKSL